MTAEEHKRFFYSLIRVEDLAHEEECLRKFVSALMVDLINTAFSPTSLRCWLRYISACAPSSLHQFFTFERAVANIPSSYKLWKMYVDARLKPLLKVQPPPKGHKAKYTDPCALLKYPSHPEVIAANECFERALIHMGKYPILWVLYARFLFAQGKVTATRRLLDRALKALPVTQHTKIWLFYVHFAEKGVYFELHRFN
jgi:pre-mRNA-splicing factor SYF1